MEALVLEYENREALNKALDVLNHSNVKGIIVTPVSAQDFQLVGKKKLVQLKERIEGRSQNEQDESDEEEIKSIVDEVRQKMYEEGLHSRH